MNFFKLYIGDYQRDTGHLSVTEHGAYLLMLQHHYATEKPLPTGKALHRLLRADSKVERDAVDAVARRFWRETEEGLVNDRAAEEFIKSAEISDTNRAIAVAREARKRARKEHEACTNRATDGARSDHDQSTNQTPDTRHQTNHSVANTHQVDQGGAPTTAGAVCARLKRDAGMIHVNPSDPQLHAALTVGVSPDQLVAVANEYPGKPLAYVVKTALGRFRDAQSMTAGGPDGQPGAATGGRVVRLSAVDRIDRAAAAAGIDLSDNGGGRTYDA